MGARSRGWLSTMRSTKPDRFWTRIGSSFLALQLLSISVSAQTASLRGLVTDLNGALVPAANQPSGAGGFFAESANNRRFELQTRLTF